MTARKILFNILGTLFVGLGVAGIVLPLLPATPFLLLASACYLRGSDRLYNWLMNHRILGSYLRNFREQRAMPKGVKIATIAILWVSVAFSMIAVDRTWVRIILGLTAVCTTIYVLRLRTLPATPAPAAAASASTSDQSPP